MAWNNYAALNIVHFAAYARMNEQTNIVYGKKIKTLEYK